MITLDIGNTRTRRILVLAALGMGALILGIWWPWGATSGLPVDAETHRVAVGSPLAGQGRPQVGGHPEDASTTAGDGLPEGLSEEQWHALNQALAHHPDREREKKRVLAYLRFEQKVLALQALDFTTFASLYNGPGQAAKYGSLIELVPSPRDPKNLFALLAEGAEQPLLKRA
mgnify:CR=1 FL=1